MEPRDRPRDARGSSPTSLMAGSWNAWWPDHALGYGAVVWAIGHPSARRYVSGATGIEPNYRKVEATGWFGTMTGNRELECWGAVRRRLPPRSISWSAKAWRGAHMPSGPSTEKLLEANARFAASFDKGDAQLPPNIPVAVLTCIDARLHPVSFLGLEIGDAHVIRNAGGRATDDALRSLIVSSQLLGTREFMVIHHTDCGMLTFTNEDIWSKLQTETGTSARLSTSCPSPTSRRVSRRT